MKKTITYTLTLTWEDEECNGLTEDAMYSALIETVGQGDIDEEDVVIKTEE